MIFLLFFVVGSCLGQVKHNLPPGVELVDPKSLGFDESQLDLSSLLGNVKLVPINSNTDPKTGLKTQVLTVGFDGEENINLDDFELPSQPQGSNNSELVQNAFQSFKQYFKNKPETKKATPTPITPLPIIRRRKVVKKQPKVVELEGDQIEKLLATGKLKSKKIGDSQVIEITQEQLDALYGGENGGEFRELLGGTQGVELQPHPPTVQLQEQQIYVPQQTTATPTVQPHPQQQPQQIYVPQPPPPPQTTPPPATPPPIIYQFNTNDYDPVPQRPHPQHIQQSSQINKHIRTPTFEFISVPPVSFSSSQDKQQQFRQDPLPNNRGKVYFPNAGTRFHRHLTPEQLNTFYEDDGLNYKDNNNKGEEALRGV